MADHRVEGTRGQGLRPPQGGTHHHGSFRVAVGPAGLGVFGHFLGGENGCIGKAADLPGGAVYRGSQVVQHVIPKGFGQFLLHVLRLQFVGDVNLRLPQLGILIPGQADVRVAEGGIQVVILPKAGVNGGCYRLPGLVVGHGRGSFPPAEGGQLNGAVAGLFRRADPVDGGAGFPIHEELALFPGVGFADGLSAGNAHIPVNLAGGAAEGGNHVHQGSNLAVEHVVRRCFRVLPLIADDHGAVVVLEQLPRLPNDQGNVPGVTVYAVSFGNLLHGSRAQPHLGKSIHVGLCPGFCLLGGNGGSLCKRGGGGLRQGSHRGKGQDQCGKGRQCLITMHGQSLLCLGVYP